MKRSTAAAAFGIPAAIVAFTISAAAQSQTPKTQTIRPYGSDITVQEQANGVRLESVLAAIDRSKATAQDVKILSKLDKARVVDIGKAFGAEQKARIKKTVEKHSDDVKELDLALEGNALTYAALKAQSVVPASIVGAELSGGGRKTITIYAEVGAR